MLATGRCGVPNRDFFTIVITVRLVQLGIDIEADPKHNGDISRLAWEHIAMFPEELVDKARESEVWTSQLKLLL